MAEGYEPKPINPEEVIQTFPSGSGDNYSGTIALRKRGNVVIITTRWISLKTDLVGPNSVVLISLPDGFKFEEQSFVSIIYPGLADVTAHLGVNGSNQLIFQPERNKTWPTTSTIHGTLVGFTA